MFIQDKNFGPTDRLRYNFQIKCYDYPAHIHQYAEIGYVVSGSLDVIVNGSRETAKEGDFILIFPMQVHEYSTPEHCDALICAFGNSLTPEFLYGTDGMVGETAVFRCGASVERYFRSVFIDGELDGVPMEKPSDPDKSDTVSHYVDLYPPESLFRVKSVLYALLDEYLGVVKLTRRDGANEPLAKVLLYLNEHYTEDITLAEVASALGYSANYLSHRIKKASGMSFNVLLGNLRVEHAVRVMTGDGEKRMIDIALESGFSNERSFHRTFKSVTGFTPGEYLRKNT